MQSKCDLEGKFRLYDKGFQSLMLISAILFGLLLTGCDDGYEEDGDKDDTSTVDSDSDTDIDTDTNLDIDVDGGSSGTDDICIPDESGSVPERSSYGVWKRIELEDTYCSDGSQYKFFVSYSKTSNNLLILFEPGGACWDYPSCSGETGIRGAANPNGIPNDHMLTWGSAYPLFGGISDPQSHTNKWNKIFLPYCTGDIFAGNKVMEYTSDDGQKTIEYRHVGIRNMMEIVPWLNEQFQNVPRMLVGGCSAGGTGSLVNYFFLREGIEGAQCGYLLNDSGPIFPSDGPSALLHEKIRASWDLDPIILGMEDELGQQIVENLMNDLGAINTTLADRFPADRLTNVHFRLDLNYSLFSYERFFNFPATEEIHELWWEDTQALMDEYDTRKNLAYFIPYYRPDNCSHCLSIVPTDHIPEILLGMVGPYMGTEIQEENINLRQYIDHLLDNEAPLKSYLESVKPKEGFTEAQAESCH
ncbi:MAG: hypothetical protein GY847_21940 [Proteobacteria bacterium]|nr:hypothetical protein [Pseudomonadota bacterium]